MRIGIYVGSFNPVHNGHITVINHLLNNDYIDKVLVIATGNYWDKDNLIDIKYRIGMLKLFENNQIMVDEEMNAIPYTYLILRELHKKYQRDELYLIIGADNIISFDKWKEYEEIIANNKILVIPRDDIQLDNYLDKYKKDKFIIVKDFDKVLISSSKIRALLTERRYNECEKYINKKIIDYIIKNNLYLDKNLI